MTDAIPGYSGSGGASREVKENALLNGLLSLVGVTATGFDFRLTLRNLFFLAAVLCALFGASFVYVGISNGDFFIEYDLGIYYIYGSIVLFYGGRIMRRIVIE